MIRRFDCCLPIVEPFEVVGGNWRRKGKQLGTPLRLDLRVNGIVLVENKAVVDWNPIFEAQMLTYLRLTKLKLGLVINFGERYVKNGIHRVVNGL